MAEDHVAKSASASIGLMNLEFDAKAKAGLETRRGSYFALPTRTHNTEQGFTPMHQIAFMLILGSTSGLFGRAPQVQSTCANGTCAQQQQYVAAPAPAYAPKYGQQPAAPAYNSYYYAPQQQQAAPVAPVAAPAYNSYYYAPQQQQAAPAAAPMYYYPGQPTANCPTGTCPYAR